MAVENLVGTAASPFALSATQKQIPTHNGMNVLSVSVEVTAAASDTSTYLMARLPAAARLHPQSLIGFDDLASTGAPTFDIGTFNLADGTADDVDAINDGLTPATASNSTPFIKDVADWGKTLWEIAGATSDPGGYIDIYVTMDDADTNTGGTLSTSICYTVD